MFYFKVRLLSIFLQASEEKPLSKSQQKNKKRKEAAAKAKAAAAGGGAGEQVHDLYREFESNRD